MQRFGCVFVFVPLLTACQNHYPLPEGVPYDGAMRAAHSVAFLADETWLDEHGERQSEQVIFDEVIRRIGGAEKLVLMDMFLFNAFLGEESEPLRPLSSDIASALLKRRAERPDMRMVVITDPVNTVYGGLRSQTLEALQKAGIEVVMTDLDRLHDSNPVYSTFWRLFIKPWGDSDADTLPNPFGEGRVSVRSYLRLLNFKANHRKVMVNDYPGGWQALVTSANPHDGSSAHRNVALSFEGPAVADVVAAENAVMRLSSVDELVDTSRWPVSLVGSGLKAQVLTESAIKTAALNMLMSAEAGDELDLLMFYLSDRSLVDALKSAHDRGVSLRVLLDPNKDAFGMEKNGIPNRPVAAELHNQGIAVRWCDTAGEQCHGKMLLLNQAQRSTLLLGSANYTRRNLDDFNLEMDVLLRGEGKAAAFVQASRHFNAMWQNQNGKAFSREYGFYADESVWKRCLYRFQEWSGLSTF